MTRSEIRALQRRLNAAGISDDRGKRLNEDGILGKRTEAALEAARKLGP